MRRRWFHVLLPYLLVVLIAGPLALWLHSELESIRGEETLTWKNPWAVLLLAGCALVAWVAFHLRARRAPSFAFSRVGELFMARRGWASHFASLPSVLRVVALGLLAVALARPQTYKTTEREVEGIDIMIVLDLSKSMEERDLRNNRLDAGQRTIRNFLKNRENDRIGLVVFAQAAMTQCPLTLDYNSLDQIVADLAIGDVPEMGTAIGDALALALSSLRRSDALSKVVILLSDGDSNMTSQFDPEEAKELAVKMGVRVFTILLGREGGHRRSAFGRGRYAVNPELLKDIARDTNGLFFRAGDDRELEESFDTVRATLEKTRRRETGKVLSRELFGYFAIPAIILLFLEIGLGLTRWRRFP